MVGKTWHERQGYETCGCGADMCRHRRVAEVRRMRRIENRELAQEMRREGWK
jgi:hypothetical protein